jgi:DNA-binding NarL/FixJ family response regulator
MVTPTTSVRLPQEHHQLVHDIVRAIKSNPAIVTQLRGVIDGCNTATQAKCNTDVLQPVYERLTILDEFTRKIMALVENVNERVKTLEQPPRKRQKRQGRVTDDLRQKAHELRAEGMTYKEIASALNLADGTVHGIINKP